MPVGTHLGPGRAPRDIALFGADVVGQAFVVLTVTKMQFSNNHRENLEKPQCVTGTWCAQGHTVRSILVCYSSVSQINYYSEMPSDPAADVVFWKGTVDVSHISPNRMK